MILISFGSTLCVIYYIFSTSEQQQDPGYTNTSDKSPMILMKNYLDIHFCQRIHTFFLSSSTAGSEMKCKQRSCVNKYITWLGVGSILAGFFSLLLCSNISSNGSGLYSKILFGSRGEPVRLKKIFLVMYQTWQDKINLQKNQ